jgi:hypothetical protein
MRFLKTLAVAGASAATLLTIGSPAQAQYVGCGTKNSSGNLTDFAAFLGANPGGCAIGDKTYSGFNTAAWGSFPSDTTISISESGALGQSHSLTFTSASGFNGPSYQFDYTVAVNATAVPGTTYDWWRPASTSSLGNPDYTVATSATNPVATVNRDETSGLSPLTNFTAGTTSSNFSVLLNTVPGADGAQQLTQTLSQIVPVSNNVPGPLPILGAAAAFGSVRKLRKFSSLVKQG